MAKVLGLGGIFFKSPDPQALADWYSKWLGLEFPFPHGVIFTANTQPATGYQVWSPFKADTDYFAPSEQSFMFNLMVDDLDAMLAQIKESGCQVMDNSERSEYGDFGWFIDPDGNKVELWQPPAKAPPQ